MARFLYTVGSVMRVLLILLSAKLPAVSKGYLLFDQAMIVIDFCLVRTEGSTQNELTMMMTIFSFCFFNTNFMVSIFAIIVGQGCEAVIRSKVHHESGSQVSVTFFADLLLMLVTVLAIHMLTRLSVLHRLKLMYECEELKAENASNIDLIAEFGEGWIVLDGQSNDVVLQNDFFDKVKLRTDEGLSSEQQMASMMNTDLFAPCPA